MALPDRDTMKNMVMATPIIAAIAKAAMSRPGLLDNVCVSPCAGRL
jgi:hypothetical protein